MTELDLIGDRQALTLFGDAGPGEILARATAIADVIAPLILQRNLYKQIGKSRHVYVEAWAMAGTMLGVYATTVKTWEIGDDDGYDATPAEEMEAAAARGETVSGGKGVAPGWRDLAEQQRAHADLGQLIQQRGLREWVATWLDSKGYERPLAKGQANQLRRAIEREVSSSRPAGGDGDPGRPAGAKTSAAGSKAPPAPAADPQSDPGAASPAAGSDPSSNPGRADRRTREGSTESAMTPGLDDPVGGDTADV